MFAAAVMAVSANAQTVTESKTTESEVMENKTTNSEVTESQGTRR